MPCYHDVTNIADYALLAPSGFDVLGIENKVDEIYAKGGYFKEMRAGLQNFVRKLPEAPLLFQPGSAFVYGFNTDVVAALVEVISGQPLDVFLRERIFDPLGMCDTDFFVPKEKYHRFSSLWMPTGATASMAAVPDPDEKPQVRMKKTKMTLVVVEHGCDVLLRHMNVMLTHARAPTKTTGRINGN